MLFRCVMASSHQLQHARQIQRLVLSSVVVSSPHVVEPSRRPPPPARAREARRRGAAGDDRSTGSPVSYPSIQSIRPSIAVRVALSSIALAVSSSTWRRSVGLIHGG